MNGTEPACINQQQVCIRLGRQPENRRKVGRHRSKGKTRLDAAQRAWKWKWKKVVDIPYLNGCTGRAVEAGRGNFGRGRDKDSDHARWGKQRELNKESESSCRGNLQGIC